MAFAEKVQTKSKRNPMRERRKKWHTEHNAKIWKWYCGKVCWKCLPLFEFDEWEKASRTNPTNRQRFDNCCTLHSAHTKWIMPSNSIQFCNLAVFIGRFDHDKIGNNFKFYCYLFIHFSFDIEYSQRLQGIYSFFSPGNCKYTRCCCFFPVPLNSWKNWCFPASTLLTSSFVSHSVWLLWILYFTGGDRVFRLRCWMNEYQMIMNTNANANAKSVIAFHVLLWHEIYGRFNRWKWFIANIYSHKYLYRSRYITTLHVLIFPNTVRALARSHFFCVILAFFFYFMRKVIWILEFMIFVQLNESYAILFVDSLIPDRHCYFEEIMISSIMLSATIIWTFDFLLHSILCCHFQYFKYSFYYNDFNPRRSLLRKRMH